MAGALPADRKDAIRVLRMIGLSMAGAVTAFALVALFLNRHAPPQPGGGSPMLFIWIAVATSLAAASMVWWRGNAVPLIDRPRQSDWRARATALQTALVVTWALVEAGALFGVVVFFLEGAWAAGALGVTMIWAALALTWPREEWLATASGATD
jgi:hypothetical protein